MDPEKATDGAIAYLTDLHNLFGDTHAVHVVLDADTQWRIEEVVEASLQVLRERGWFERVPLAKED